jgi:acyl carrier protein
MIEIEERLSRIIAKGLAVEATRITPAASFRALGANRLDFLDLIVQVEEAFNVGIPASAVEKIQTVGDLITFIKGNRR